MASGDYDTMFSNLPGSPRRPTPPPDNRSLMQTMFPVDPRAVAGGLYDQGAEAVGRFAADTARQPFPGIAPNVGLPNADLLGRDVTGYLQSPIHGGVSPSAATHTALATAWAPAAWMRIKTIAKTEPEVASTIASLTPAEAPGYFFDSNVHNDMLSDVMTAHLQDQHLVARTMTPPDLTFGPPPDPGQYRAQLEELRGQRPMPPSQPPQPNGPSLADFLYGSQSNAVQPASTPWNTFKLQPPNMPPFPANDPYPMSPPPQTPRPWPPPPGMTLNTPPNWSP
jgi:hypothetical protein